MNDKERQGSNQQYIEMVRNKIKDSPHPYPWFDKNHAIMDCKVLLSEIDRLKADFDTMREIAIEKDRGECSALGQCGRFCQHEGEVDEEFKKRRKI